MKHVKTLSRTPAQAEELTLGQIISVVAEILAVIGAALITKDAPPQLPGSGGE